MLALPLLVVGLSFQFATQSRPAVTAATQPNAEYPLRIQMKVTSMGNYTTPGYGRGNVMGETPTGFDFVEDCNLGYTENNDRQLVYQARWKKRQQKLEILLQEMRTKDDGSTGTLRSFDLCVLCSPEIKANHRGERRRSRLPPEGTAPCHQNLRS